MKRLHQLNYSRALSEQISACVSRHRKLVSILELSEEKMDNIFNVDELRLARKIYARQILAIAGVRRNEALAQAFEEVPRESFIGPPPWSIVRSLRNNRVDYLSLASSDAVMAYQDVRFALAPGKGVNNGSPSLHANWLDSLAPKPGEKVVHIGAGTGYYSAILANLVGNKGQVIAVEYDEDLANQARANLVDFKQVEVVTGDGALWPRSSADCIYVNCCSAFPAAPWIKWLDMGGRLIFPLGVPGTAQKTPGKSSAEQYRHTLYGAGVRLERTPSGILAKSLGHALFVFGEGGLSGSEADQLNLRRAFELGGIHRVKSFLWSLDAPSDAIWYSGDGWALSFEDVKSLPSS